MGGWPTGSAVPLPAPLGGPALRSVKIDEFAPPRSRLPLVVTLVVLLLAGLIWGATMLRPAAAPAPAVSASPSPSPTPTLPGLPFISQDQEYAGRWQILEHRWTDAGLEVEIMLAVDRGPFGYSFVAFENSGIEPARPTPGSDSPRFSGRPIDSGQQETGWLFFPLERGPATIILSTEGGNQMSALAVSG